MWVTGSIRTQDSCLLDQGSIDAVPAGTRVQNPLDEAPGPFSQVLPVGLHPQQRSSLFPLLDSLPGKRRPLLPPGGNSGVGAGVTLALELAAVLVQTRDPVSWGRDGPVLGH